MSIIRLTHRQSYTPISNKTINDPDLKLDELGFLIRLLSLPPTWEVHTNHLAETFGVCIEKARKTIRRLVQLGYMEVEQRRSGRAQFAGLDYIVYEERRETIQKVSPETVLPCTVPPSSAKPHLQKKHERKEEPDKSPSYEGVAHPPALVEFAPRVWLKQDQYEALCQEEGKESIDGLIDRMSRYIAQSKKDPYAKNKTQALRNWIHRDKEDGKWKTAVVEPTEITTVTINSGLERTHQDMALRARTALGSCVHIEHSGVRIYWREEAGPCGIRSSEISFGTDRFSDELVKLCALAKSKPVNDLVQA